MQHDSGICFLDRKPGLKCPAHGPDAALELATRPNGLLLTLQLPEGQTGRARSEVKAVGSALPGQGIRLQALCFQSKL